MRYYWGLAVGHIYSHNTSSPTQTSSTAKELDKHVDLEPDLEKSTIDTGLITQPLEQENDVRDGDDPELSFENREDDFIDELEEVVSEEGVIEGDELLTTEDMYGYSYYDYV